MQPLLLTGFLVPLMRYYLVDYRMKKYFFILLFFLGCETFDLKTDNPLDPSNPDYELPMVSITLLNYISLDKKPPNTMAILVKNNMGIESKDKPIKYDIISITNDNYAIWKPICEPEQISLGHIVSKEYPSKYLIRTIPKKWCEKSNVNNRITKNKISKIDKGYELWNINGSNLFICNCSS